MNRITLKLIIISLIALATSCDGLNCIEGNNDIVNFTRNVGEYTSVKTAGDYDVYLHADSTYDIVLTGESNILPYVNTEINGTELEIRDFPRTCLRENSQVSLDTYCPSLKALTISGSGDMVADTFSGNVLDLNIYGSGNIEGTFNFNDLNSNISGSGDIEIRGNINDGYYEINGSGDVNALFCYHQNATIEINGSGNVYIHVIDNLNIKIAGSGNVYYTGNPTISSQIYGSGTIINYNK